MPKKKTKINKKKITKKRKKRQLDSGLRSDVKKHIVAVLLFLFALVFVLSVFNAAGVVGGFLSRFLTMLFGSGRYVLPVLMVALGVMYFRKMPPIRYVLATIGMFLLFFALLGFGHLLHGVDRMSAVAGAGEGGGYFGYGIAYLLVLLIGRFAGLITLLALMLIGFMLLFNISIFHFFPKLRNGFLGKILNTKKFTFTKREISKEEDVVDNSNSEADYDNVSSADNIGEGVDVPESKVTDSSDMPEALVKDDEKYNIKSVHFSEDTPGIGLSDFDGQNASVESREVGVAQSTIDDNQNERDDYHGSDDSVIENPDWPLLPISIFETTRTRQAESNVQENIRIIKETLLAFGIEVKEAGYNIGPTVTQYTFSSPPSVLLSNIKNKESNLAMALAAQAVRVEAPIPGTSLFGVEVPNSKMAMVRLGNLLKEKKFLEADSHLTIALGKDISGKSVVASLEDMPHLLVAGSTNTGKSVCINAILSSLLFKNSPDDLQLILVDPKRVELTAYNGIPHLITKVITDMNKVVNALKWATGEMDNRYKILEKYKSKNIVSYHQKIQAGKKHKEVDEETGEVIEKPLPKMPYIVIVIDELADLMTTHGKEVDVMITRLSQMARAVGIHLILSTQRPDTNVITGTIKNNIPARIAFKVSSQIDSRTILNHPGAEKLLGNGDMLYIGPNYPQATRIQAPFISEKETLRLIKAIKKQQDKLSFAQDDSLQKSLEDKLEEVIQAGSVGEGESSGDDELYLRAKEIVIQSKRASVSFLQRRLSIGYNRAARIVDMLEENGVVGPEGSGPKGGREVLLASEQMAETVSGPEGDMEVQMERDRRIF